MTDKLELGRAKLIHEFGSGPLRCLIANNIFLFLSSRLRFSGNYPVPGGGQRSEDE